MLCKNNKHLFDRLIIDRERSSNCWLLPCDTESYNDHQAIATCSTLMELPSGAQVAVCGGYEGMSDNKYDRPIIDVLWTLTFQLPARREQNVR